MRGLLLAVLLGLASPVFAVDSPGRLGMLATVTVNEEIGGDVISLAGDIHLGADARVRGHAIAIFGAVTKDPGARVGGRTIAIASLASLSLQPGSDFRFASLDAAVRILSSGGWLLLTTALAFMFPKKMRTGSQVIPELRLRVPVLGLIVVLTLFTALVAVLGLGEALAAPLAASLIVVFFAFKTVGLTVIGGALGSALLSPRSKRHLPLTFHVFVGVAILLLVRLIPLLGGPAWTLVSVIALGAGVFTLTLDPEEQAWIPSLRPST